MAITKIITNSIADTAISTAKIADDAIDDTKLDLTDDYAFTGTITGVSSGAGSVDAWVNFNGTGTVAINGSGNVSSVTDNSTGVYTVNFSTNFSDANYCHLSGGTQQTGVGNNGFTVLFGTDKTTSSFKLIFTVGNTAYDNANINMAFVR